MNNFWMLFLRQLTWSETMAVPINSRPSTTLWRQYFVIKHQRFRRQRRLNQMSRKIIHLTHHQNKKKESRPRFIETNKTRYFTLV